MNFTFLDIKKGEIHSINFSSVRGILAAKKMRVLKKEILAGNAPRVWGIFHSCCTDILSTQRSY